MKLLRIILISMLIGMIVPISIMPADTAKAADYADVVVTFTPKCYGATPIFTTQNATSVTHNSARLNGVTSNLSCEDASDIFWEWGLSSGNYTANYTDTTDYGNESVYYDLTGLNQTTTYYFRGAARLDGEAWQYGSELSFTTEVEPTIIYPPDPFTVEQNGVNSANVTWTQGVNSDNVVIRASTSSYPTTITDGYLVYSGNASQYTHEGLSLDMSTIYYSAWGEAGGEYSTTYSTARIGGDNMVLLMLGMITLGVSWFSLRRNNMLFSIASAAMWAWLMGYLVSNYTDMADNTLVIALATLVVAFFLHSALASRLKGSKKILGTDSVEAYDTAMTSQNAQNRTFMNMSQGEYAAYLRRNRQNRRRR